MNETAMQRKAKKRKGLIETKAQQFDKLVNECIGHLIKEEIKLYVDGVKELAMQLKSAGSDNQAFLDLCQHIEQTVINKTGNKFLEMRIKLAIQDEFRRQSGLIKV